MFTWIKKFVARIVLPKYARKYDIDVNLNGMKIGKATDYTVVLDWAMTEKSNDKDG